MKYYSTGNGDANHWRKQLPNVLVFFFLLQQFGLSYHVSFGSAGLLLICYLTKHNIPLSSFKVPYIFTFLFTLSYFFVLIRYGYEKQLLRLLPTLVCAFFLLLILRYETSIKLPSASVLVGSTIIICLILWYQLFFDRSFQVPERFFSLGSNSSFSVNADVYDLYKYSLRSNGIYSEPSYLGMILCCMYVLIFKSTLKYKIPAMLLVIFTQILTGSGLGIVGLFVLTIALMHESSYRFSSRNIVFVVVIVPITIFVFTKMLSAYDFSFASRLIDAKIGNDASFMVRFLNPFILIYENVINFDWLGVPSNFYDHFLYTRLYDTHASFPGHNGILGLLIQYGIVGILMLFVLLRQLRSPVEIVLLFIIGSQNGGFLTYEKVFSMLFVILALRGAPQNGVTYKPYSIRSNY